MLTVPPEFWVVSFAMLGAILGSYINMAAYRLPRNISTVTRTRSFCPNCDHQLAWYDNVPILSYLSLLGRCRYCHKPIPVRYLLVELLVSGLFAASAWQFLILNHEPYNFLYFRMWQMHPAIFFAQLFLITDLMLLAVTDLETWLIPPQTTLPGMVLGLVLAPLLPGLHLSATAWTGSPALNAFLDSFMGLVIGAGIPWSVNLVVMGGSFVWFKLKGIKARPLEGMGAGDAHLLGMVGAILGWKPAVAAFFLGLFIGCATGILKILWTKLQRWRLGDTYRPWQPTFEVPKDAAPPQAQSYWPLLVMAAVVLVVCCVLWHQSSLTFDGTLRPTAEESQLMRYQYQRPFGDRQVFDARLLPVGFMFCIGLLLPLAYLLQKHLAATDNLPQGDIVETAAGEKQEVMQGNYIPFGPSLAAGALLVAFYDPLIRAFVFWWLAGAGQGTFPLPAYEVPCREIVTPVLERFVQALSACSQWLVGG
jgi:leader peptidase (prepilin peptidase)/N-methyltransferase